MIKRINPLLSWEQGLARVLRVLRLEEIKRKILVFALLATLTPSLTMGWFFYIQNDRVITEKVSEELKVVAAQTAREVDIWIKQRLYELRVFSGSYEVSENLEKSATRNGNPEALQRLKAYLSSVGEKFDDYEELVVLDPRGQTVASSMATASKSVSLSDGWLNRMRVGDAMVGEAYMDEDSRKPLVNLAVPVIAADSRLLGVLAARLNFHSIEELMSRSAMGQTGQVYLVDADAGLITSSGDITPTQKKTPVPEAVMRTLGESTPAVAEYVGLSQRKVVGATAPSAQVEWAVVAEITRAEAYAPAARNRNITLLITLAMVLVVGSSAYFLGSAIVRPLNRLIAGSRQVAKGNLRVSVPVIGGGEVGYLTEVFNYMLSKLRRDQSELAAVNDALRKTNEELQELSITDSLTGLYNRRYMMDALAKELARAQRQSHQFSILMIDIDHFKKYNDTHGHLAGDELLIKVGSIFRQSIRSIDLAARYGGEEFLVILSGHGSDEARAVAERIRAMVASSSADGSAIEHPVTVSVGAATFPENGIDAAQLIASADAALYQAKRQGRNSVVLADTVAAGESPAKRAERA